MLNKGSGLQVESSNPDPKAAPTRWTCRTDDETDFRCAANWYTKGKDGKQVNPYVFTQVWQKACVRRVYVSFVYTRVCTRGQRMVSKVHTCAFVSKQAAAARAHLLRAKLCMHLGHPNPSCHTTHQCLSCTHCTITRPQHTKILSLSLSLSLSIYLSLSHCVFLSVSLSHHTPTHTHADASPATATVLGRSLLHQTLLPATTSSLATRHRS